MVYRFYTGGRRDAGLQQHRNLIQYIREKYEKEPAVGCSGCGKGRTRTTTPRVASAPAPVMPRTASVAHGSRMVMLPARGGSKQYVTSDGRRVTLSDDQLVLARYMSEQRGERPVVGPYSRLRYSMHSPGDIFLVDRQDLQSPLFQEVRVETTPLPVTPVVAPPPPPGTPQPAPVQQAQPVLHVAPVPDVAQDAEDGGLPPGLASIADATIVTQKVPVTPPEAGQFMEPQKLTVDQMRALLGRPSTSTAMVRAMLATEQASEKPRASAIKLLEERLAT